MAKKKKQSKQPKKTVPMKTTQKLLISAPSWQGIVMVLSFFYIELFGWTFLGEGSSWPLAFGAMWALALTGLIRALPRKTGRILYGISYFFLNSSLSLIFGLLYGCIFYSCYKVALCSSGYGSTKDC